MDVILKHGVDFWPHCAAILSKYFSLINTLVVVCFLVVFNVLCVLVTVQMSEVSVSVCLFSVCPCILLCLCLSLGLFIRLFICLCVRFCS